MISIPAHGIPKKMDCLRLEEEVLQLHTMSFLVVMNGESSTQELSHSEVEVLNTKTGEWSNLPELEQGRHGTGIIYFEG